MQSAGGHEKDELQSSIHLRDRGPAYSTRGGIFEVLIETQGDMLVADNLEGLHAKRLFEETEGIDIDPESAVTFAALLKAAWYNGIEKEALVLLNVTEAGRYRQQLVKELISARRPLISTRKRLPSTKPQKGSPACLADKARLS